jgi:hypothetical protein
MGLSYGALATVTIGFAIIAASVAVVVVLLHGASPGADRAKARAEVQRYFDARAPGKVNVRACTYAPVDDSDFETFSCSVEVACQRRFVFSVPRAAASFRADMAPRPRAKALPLRCGGGTH